jgi:PRC-barrel domain
MAERTGGAPPPLAEALGWVGHRLDDMDGSRVGSVQAIYVDVDDGRPVWVVAKLGRFGKVTAIPLSECAEGPGRVWTAHARKTIRGAPAVDPGEPLSREQEKALCEHYLIRPDRGRGAVVEQRGAETVTAKPAEQA